MVDLKKICATKCHGIDGCRAGCCSLEDRNYIIGPIDKESQDRILKHVKDKTWDDVFVNYLEGKDMFPDREIWQQESSYPALRPKDNEIKSCTFYDDENSVCSIYAHRPTICGNYLCSYLKELYSRGDIYDKLKSYINNSKDIHSTLELAVEYEKQNQTASAVSFYQRVVELSDNNDIVYEMLIKCGQCLASHEYNAYSVRGLYLQAISHIPIRPEAYYFLSEMYQGDNHTWQESYTTAVCGLEYIKNERNVSGVDLLYPGDYGLIFNKAVSAWWIGRIEESKNIFLDLKNNYVMNDLISQLVNNNLNNTNFYDF